jgi:hypothetical protein
MKELKKLIYIPILHSREDESHPSSKSRLSEADGNRKLPAAEEMWKGIATKIAELNLPWNQTRIYFDGMPVCGNEMEIVKRLSGSGSPSFLFLSELILKNAKLEGTENLELLLKEYDLLNNLLMKDPTKDMKATIAEYQLKSRELLLLRDEFILTRIKSTLQSGDVPIVFMGVMHRLDKLLEKDFLVSYVIYRLPFRSFQAVYNS